MCDKIIVTGECYKRLPDGYILCKKCEKEREDERMSTKST